jgi:hypothetical protein
MRIKTLVSLFLGSVLVLGLSIAARSDGDRRDNDDRDCRDSEHHQENRHTPVSLVGVIPIPGAAIASADIAWTDPGTERYFFADRSNSGVDIIDAEDDVFAGRVTGFAGALTSGGGTSTSNGPGPNGVLVTADRRLWAGDGNSLAQVADVDPNSATYLKILQPGGISTAIPACDGGTATTHYCGRADELGYDPKDKVIIIANNAPLSKTAPHGPIDPFATFIDAKTLTVKGHVSFPGAGGLEQPLWNAEKQRFLITVPGALNTTGTAVVLPASIQVINPITMLSEKTYTIDCNAIAGTLSASITGIALGPFQHILVSACGFPIVLTLNASTGKINVLNVIKQVGGGDEVWFDPGDGRFYVTGPLNGVSGMTQQLGDIDAENGAFLQNVSELGLRGKNPAAFPENNHIFTIQQINAAIRDNNPNPTPDDSLCATFGFNRTGCIAIFEHKDAPESTVVDDDH